MGLPLRKNRRISPRRQLTGLLPGRLSTDDGSEIQCRPVDVSRNGVGVLSEQILEIGSKVYLSLSDESIVPLTIAWSRPDFAKIEMVRYGFVTMNAQDDMVLLFDQAGCYK